MRIKAYLLCYCKNENKYKSLLLFSIPEILNQFAIFSPTLYF